MDNERYFLQLLLGRLLTIILSCNPWALQIRLDNYFKEIGHKEEVVSKQAFSKARTNLDPDIVKASFELTAKTLSNYDDLELFKGNFRLCALDGSEVIFDNTKELLEYFGGCGSKSDCAPVLASLCYDPLNNQCRQLKRKLLVIGLAFMSECSKFTCALWVKASPITNSLGLSCMLKLRNY